MNNTKQCGSCNTNCINEILRVICVLQENACPENCLDTCDRPMLGGGPCCLICNTRPVTLYTCCGNGAPWSMPLCKDSTYDCSGEENVNNCSVIFRVEKIEGNCCTFRVLAQNPDDNCLNPYLATNSFFTMDCSCLCAVKCLTDTYVDCVC